MQYVEFINHVKAHLVEFFTNSEHLSADKWMSEEDANFLVHYEILDFERWKEFVDMHSGVIDALMPPTCDWTFMNEEGHEEICDYHFQDLFDLLGHYYYHAHQVRIKLQNHNRMVLS